MPTTLLSDIAPHTVARVAALDVHPEDAIRLKALGLCVGRQVQLVQTGDPLLLRILGTRVGLSARLAAGIRVVAASDPGQQHTSRRADPALDEKRLSVS